MERFIFVVAGATRLQHDTAHWGRADYSNSFPAAHPSDVVGMFREESEAADR
jgi:hypothetical protein